MTSSLAFYWTKIDSQVDPHPHPKPFWQPLVGFSSIQLGRQTLAATFGYLLHSCNFLNYSKRVVSCLDIKSHKPATTRDQPSCIGQMPNTGVYVAAQINVKCSLEEWKIWKRESPRIAYEHLYYLKYVIVMIIKKKTKTKRVFQKYEMFHDEIIYD